MNRLLFALLLSASLAFAFTSGDGTYENPYEIAGQSDIVNLIDMVATNDCSGLYFLQTADIDLSVFGNFQGIGSISADKATTNAFSGNYDGNGFYFTNFYMFVSSPSVKQEVRGFFNYALNATLENFEIYGSISNNITAVSGYSVMVGSVCAWAKNCLAENIVSFVNQDAYVVSAGSAVVSLYNGGIFGMFSFVANSSFHNWKFYGDVNIKTSMSGGCRYFGLAGHVSKTASGGGYLYDIVNYGDLKVSIGTSGATIPLHGTIFYSAGFRNSQAIRCVDYGNFYFEGGAVDFCRLNIAGGDGVSVSAFINYGNIYATIEPKASNDGASGNTLLCNGARVSPYYTYLNSITNCGNIYVSSALSNASITACGVLSGTQGVGYMGKCYNFGDISVNATKPPSFLSVGGVAAHSYSNTEEERFFLKTAVNGGKISINVEGSSRATDKIGIAGVAALSAKNDASNRNHACHLGNGYNFGNITLNLPSDYKGLAVLSGIASYYSEKLSDFTCSNTYNVGSLKWSGKNIKVGGLVGFATTTAYSDEYTHLRNCYQGGLMEGSTEGNIVGSICGVVSNVLGAVSISNCFAISQYPAFGAFYGGATNNNVASYTYEQFYRNPNSQAFLYNYAFTNSGRDTNSYYDLSLPINKLLFPTIDDKVKSLHNWAKINGFKHYIKTIQQ